MGSSVTFFFCCGIHIHLEKNYYCFLVNKSHIPTHKQTHNEKQQKTMRQSLNVLHDTLSYLSFFSLGLCDSVVCVSECSLKNIIIIITQISPLTAFRTQYRIVFVANYSVEYLFRFSYIFFIFFSSHIYIFLDFDLN